MCILKTWTWFLICIRAFGHVYLFLMYENCASEILYTEFCKRDKNCSEYNPYHAIMLKTYTFISCSIVSFLWKLDFQNGLLNHSALEIDRPHWCTLSECRRLHVYLDQIGPDLIFHQVGPDIIFHQVGWDFIFHKVGHITYSSRFEHISYSTRLDHISYSTMFYQNSYSGFDHIAYSTKLVLI